MLSKPGTIILGIIDERETNAYEMLKFLEYINIKHWFYISESTVYTTIKTLETKGYIKGRKVRDGNMPEKTLYTTTKEGKQELITSLEAFLGNTELDYVMFNIAVIMICHLEQKCVEDILKKKYEAVKERKKRLQIQLEKMNHANPLDGVHAVRHMMLLTESEITSVEELMQKVKTADKWDRFLARN